MTPSKREAHRRSPWKRSSAVGVDRLEPLADAEQEHADHGQRDQHREGDRDLDHERHALGAGGGEDQPVLERHEADHHADRVAPHHHHQHAEQHDRQREGEILARERVGVAGDAQHHHDRQRDQREAGEHGRADADDVLDVALDAELAR